MRQWYGDNCRGYLESVAVGPDESEMNNNVTSIRMGGSSGSARRRWSGGYVECAPRMYEDNV